MTARRIYVPDAQPSRDPNGRALPAKLYFYEPTGTYDTPKAVYTDNTLTTALAFPVLSNAAGRFPAIWADDAETFDVVWADQVFNQRLGAWTNITPLSDAMVASAAAAEAAADEAEASAAEAAEVVQGVEATAADAAASAAAAEAARDAVQDVADELGTGPYNAYYYGAVGDGSTDNLAAVRALLAAGNGQRLSFGAGTYRIDVPSGETDILTPETNSVITGLGPDQTTLKFVVADTNFHNLIKHNAAGLTIENLTLEVSSVAGSSAVLLFQRANSLTLRNVRLIGDVQDTAGVVDRNIWGHKFGAESTGTTFIDCYAERLIYLGLKESSATFATRKVRFIRVDTSNLYAGGPNLNSPNGVLDDILVEGGTLDTNPRSSGDVMLAGLASGTNARFHGLHLKGTAQWGMHFEERCERITVSDVTAELNGSGLWLLDNDVNSGGVSYRPQGVSLSGLQFKNTGSRGSTEGVAIIYDAEGITSAARVQIANSCMENYAIGYTLAVKPADSIAFVGSTAYSCTNGIFAPYPRLFDLAGFTADSCDVGIKAEQGGVFRNPTFTNCTLVAQNTTGGVMILQNPNFNVPGISQAASTSRFVRLVQNVARMEGVVTGQAWAAATNYAWEISDIDYDGTTATITVDNSADVGSLVLTLYMLNEAVSATVAAGGSGYAVGNVLTAPAGTRPSNGMQSTFTVTSVSGGAVTGVSVTNPGEYNLAGIPSNPASMTGGAGTGCTLNITWRKSLVLEVFNGPSVARTPEIAATINGAVVVANG